MILAWLLLLTGLTISAVAIYYSVVGLAAIFSAAVIPIIVMGSALEVAKLVCASWLKANWSKAPRLMKFYMTVAVAVLMLITSMGIFGFLSKAHSDQSLVSGDVMSKIAIYDEKIKTAKENIEADRKQLKQMDEAVDQVMGRSTDEKGADKANAIRKSQQRDRSALAKDIEANQKLIATLNDEAAPIRAEVRKVEAEVGPLKYIAAFVYGATDESILERAVTWVIITIIVVFDPLAVIMLLAAQMTFGWHRKNGHDPLEVETVTEAQNSPKYELDDGPLTDDQLAQINALLDEAKVVSEPEIPVVVQTTKLSEVMPEEVQVEQVHTPAPVQGTTSLADVMAEPTPAVDPDLQRWNAMIEEAEKAVAVEAELQRGEELIQAEEASIPDVERPGDYLPETEESKKKTYMTKDPKGHIQIKETK
jgi:hypothetical protein